LRELGEAYAAIDRDLQAAKKFQKSFIPRPCVSLNGFDVSFHHQPAGHVGGDIVGMFPVNDSEVGIYAVDVSGHGVSSALMTAQVASYFDSGSSDQNVALDGVAPMVTMLPPCVICKRLNQLLVRDSENTHYLTMMLVHLNLESGVIKYCQAGHPFPVIDRSNGESSVLRIAGMPIGLVEDATYETSSLKLSAGDRMLIYSDGLSECVTENGSIIDDSGLLRILSNDAHATRRLDLGSLVKAVREETASGVFDDDVSAVLIERTH